MIPFLPHGYYTLWDSSADVGSIHACNVRNLVVLRYLLDFLAEYESISTTYLSDNPAVDVLLMTINGWILMMRKQDVAAVSFYVNWSEYRDGFGSATEIDNYWLGLEKVYRLLQFGNLKLRIEVNLQ